MDFTEWLGVGVTVGDKEKLLPDRVKRALQRAWDEDILEEDDVPEDGTTMDDERLENELKIMMRGLEDFSAGRIPVVSGYE